MQVTKSKKKSKILEILKRKYDGAPLAGFDTVLELVMSARSAREASKLLMPLLRQRLVLINPDSVEAIEVLEEKGEPVIKVHLLSKEVKITKHEVSIESIIIFAPNPWV